jgi:transcriptional regulator with XRE-family HTH domain
LAGASPSTIKRWEAGKGLPARADIEQYLVSFGASGIAIGELAVKKESGGRPIQRMLRAKRRRSNLTLEEISALTGICVASLHRYETGERAPEPEIMGPLARAFGCTEAEAELFSTSSDASPATVVEEFLAPGLSPHYWLYRRLDEKIAPNAEGTPNEILDLVHGFMIMGDHRGLLEAWDMLNPSVRGLSFSPDERAMIGLSLALARLTIHGDTEYVRERVAKWRANGLPTAALAHLSRLVAALGDIDESESLLDRLSCLAAKQGDAGSTFMSDVQRIMLAFTRTRSPGLLSALDRLREDARGPLQGYTVDVARLHMLDRLVENAELEATLERCQHDETRFGFGSPLAARIGRRLGAA